MIFEENGATYDFYDDDVVYCNDLYTTYNNYDYNAGGILFYETPISQQLTERWHDPVIDN
ncbi:MAG: hypothetical protein IK142_02410 [Clostridiales bacterium]|nr:hypothetical protein [Clostridiales bacterium]